MKNMILSETDHYKVTVGSKLSGDPVVKGQITGVAIADSVSSETVIVRKGVFTLTVAGIDNSGVGGADANSAVAEGDAIYINTGDTPVLSKRADGVLFGYAGTGAAVTSGNTTTAIPVLLK
jgi:predicted RecA/RadA family phage recombinase